MPYKEQSKQTSQRKVSFEEEIDLGNDEEDEDSPSDVILNFPFFLF